MLRAMHARAAAFADLKGGASVGAADMGVVPATAAARPTATDMCSNTWAKVTQNQKTGHK